MGRFIPVTVCYTAEKRIARVANAKVCYDGKQCWQYKVVYDRPGTYSFTPPPGITCVRTVIVGGGGKPICTNGNCCGFGGAGGAYSEKCMTVNSSTVLSITVGRQQQDSSVSCNTVSVHTAGGAVGCTPGSASGGDWNSRGGCASYTCNYCGGSVSHYCGACICITSNACCGYCLVYAYNPTQHGDANGCCIANYPGGGSAGSPRHPFGGCSYPICSSGTVGHGSIATGGGGVGSQCWDRGAWHFNCCECACPNFDGNAGGGCQFFQSAYPTSASGGGGSHGSIPCPCRSWDGICQRHYWLGGAGGPGGKDIPITDACANMWDMNWNFRYNDSYGGCCYMWRMSWNPKNCDPCKKEWWDICDISGAGSPGFVNSSTYFWCCSPTQMSGLWGRPSHSGEGAGTGGVTFRCCNPDQFGDAWPIWPNGPSQAVNWITLCCIGLMGDPFRCDAGYNMKDKLFGGFVTCAGTLGGSGGVGVCHFSSKAGFGGGGGAAKCHIICVCWGGAYDCCNQVGSTPLAFPPCLLDNIINNAGSGLAIIYYKEA